MGKWIEREMDIVERAIGIYKRVTGHFARAEAANEGLNQLICLIPPERIAEYLKKTEAV